MPCVCISRVLRIFGDWGLGFSMSMASLMSCTPAVTRGRDNSNNSNSSSNIADSSNSSNIRKNGN